MKPLASRCTAVPSIAYPGNFGRTAGYDLTPELRKAGFAGAQPYLMPAAQLPLIETE